MSAIAVAAGTISLKKVMALLVFANTFTLQKLTGNTPPQRAEIIRPGTVNSPGRWRRAVQLLRPGPGPGLMYCTDASASTGITETMGNPGRQPATNHQRPVGVWP